MKIAIIQPTIPYYREDFFKYLKDFADVDLYVFKKNEIVKKEHTKISCLKTKDISKINFKGLLLYNPWPFISSLNRYDIIVLMLDKTHITTWLLLLTKWLHKKKIILWGQGISVKRYLKEEITPDTQLLFMMKKADGIWLYMEKEYNQISKIITNKPIVALNNTITGIEKILAYKGDKFLAKEKYKINEDIIFIFCARFESNYRRTDLLIDIIKRLDKNKYGFIIIGEGKNKPDFSSFKNVHDFGTIYDTSTKSELFSAADIYLQPGWMGLSVVEAMAYKLPIFTFIRSKETKQCVEYSYIKDGINGCIFKDLNDFISRLNNMKDSKLKEMGTESYNLAQQLTPYNMAKHAIQVIEQI